MALLLACSNDSSTINSNTQSYLNLKEVESIYDLGACTDNRKGEIIFVTDNNKDFICYSNKWIPSDELDKVDKEKAENSSSSKREVSSSSKYLLENASSSSAESSADALEISSCSDFQETTSSSSISISASSTDSTFTDPRDKQTYRIVTMGKQVWFAENLNYSNEDVIGFCHENDPEKCDIYGKLYRWDDAMKACPEGWHLPNLFEWRELIDFVGGQELAGVKLKTKAYWVLQESFQQYAGTDDYGFSVLPASFMSAQGTFGSTIRGAAHIWTSTEVAEDIANLVFFMHSMGKVVLDKSEKELGFSVRCLKDSD